MYILYVIYAYVYVYVYVYVYNQVTIQKNNVDMFFR